MGYCASKPLTLKVCCHDADQQLLDNSIPLSPQWLYAKPTDAKVCVHCLDVVCFAAILCFRASF
jgi:hypothetical protein